jgi:ArsR family transcriptional regulator, lead/cadmium/zinc/bismuth-responsive transcriptional repressor
MMGSESIPDQDLRCKHEDHGLRKATWLPDWRELETAAEMFRALADPLRLRLLSRLASGEACVTELAALEGEKLTTISARLQSLLGARLVKRRRNAKHVFYALADDHVLMLVRSAIDHATERILPPAQAGTSIKETRR